MVLPEVFKAEGIPEESAAAVLIAKFVGGRRQQEVALELDWTKAADGCWYAEGWSFTPMIAKLGDLQGAFEFVGRKGPSTPW